MDFKPKDLIKILDVDLIKQGDYLWSNGDIVEIKDVEMNENRIEVWNINKTLSELINIHEFTGIEIIK